MNKFANMQIFARVAELESFTQAAEQLGIPKARVSNAVQELEGHIGLRLLHRTTRRVRLTSDGMAYYQGCLSILTELDALESHMQDASTIAGTIRVDMSLGTAANIVIPFLPEFYAQYPNIKLELSCVDYRVDLVREGFDCVVRIGHMEDSNLIARRIGDMRILNCVSASYIEKFGEPSTLEDLKQHQLIEYSMTLGAKPYGFEYWDGKHYSAVQMPSSISVNNVAAYVAACQAGLGIIQAPINGVRHYLASGELVEVLTQFSAEPMPVYLVYANRHNISKRVQVFMDWVVEVLKRSI
ncbi:HTH-type transcriptional regulator DmlR [Thalassocella blandensis]|nr:HTH-type transcriptional regulator DmlR [Thalassocella blandensis]